MSERQKKILSLLKKNEKNYISIKQIAEELGCSEKTVRTEFKKIDEWLSLNNLKTTIVRKPNKGVMLDLPKEESAFLSQHLHEVSMEKRTSYDEERFFDMLHLLLDKNKTFNIEELAQQFYVNKMVIKKDLKKIEKWLEKFHLTISSKQKSGIQIQGNERDWRSALSKALQASMEKHENTHVIHQSFLNHEIEQVRYVTKQTEKKMPYPLTQTSFQNIVIHILIAIKRIKLKHPIELPTYELSDIKNKKEYLYAKELTERLERSFSLRFPEHEIAYIALHFIGSKYEVPMNEEMISLLEVDPNLSSFTERIILNVSDFLNIDFSIDYDLYSSLSLHLHSAYYRLKHGLFISNPLVHEIKKMNPYLFEVIWNVSSSLEKDYLFSIPEDEVAYICLHFQASLERLKKTNGRHNRILIVCSMGIGVSQLLKTKLERKFHSLHVLDCLSYADTNTLNDYQADLVISTVPINSSTVPVLVISPFLREDEQKKIELFLKQKEKQDRIDESLEASLNDILKEDLIVLHSTKEHRFQVIEELGFLMEKKGYITRPYVESSIIRERNSSTCIGGGIAIPHGQPEHILRPAIAIATLREPIEWGTEKVSCVFMLAHDIENKLLTKKIFESLSLLSENQPLLEELLQKTTPKDFYNRLETLTDR